MMGISLLDLCSYLGLGAVGAASVNLLLGMLMSLRYSPMRHGPHRHINVFALHQWTAYIAIALTLTHPLVLLFIPTPHFASTTSSGRSPRPCSPSSTSPEPSRLYLLVLVFISSLLRTRIGRPLWRNLHYLVFPAAILLFIHSILTDPNLKDGHPDLLDGGKVFVEIATLVSVVAVGVRVWRRGRGFRAERV